MDNINDTADTGPGVLPKQPGNYERFTLVDRAGRRLSVLDMGDHIEVAGLRCVEPDHVDEFADRLVALAANLRGRQAAGGDAR